MSSGWTAPGNGDGSMVVLVAVVVVVVVVVVDLPDWRFGVAGSARLLLAAWHGHGQVKGGDGEFGGRAA